MREKEGEHAHVSLGGRVVVCSHACAHTHTHATYLLFERRPSGHPSACKVTSSWRRLRGVVAGAVHTQKGGRGANANPSLSAGGVSILCECTTILFLVLGAG